MKKFYGMLVLFCVLISNARAEVQLLHSFEFGLEHPYSPLVQAQDGNFYGTAQFGGAGGSIGGAGVGGIFRVTPTGVISNICSFFGTNGANPTTGLLRGPGGLLYGTTPNGGANSLGTVFSVTTSGVLTVLYSFDGPHGALPQSLLTMGIDGKLYGTTPSGGANNRGTVFSITTGGSLTTLYSFTTTNASPSPALCLGPDGNFYGTTQSGPGTYNYGTIFRITPAGAFTQLVGLTNTIGTVGSTYSMPSMLVVGNVIYGTLYSGGINGFGSFYSLTTDGVFTPLLAFTSGTGGQPGGLTLGADGNFYGTGQFSGTGYGMVFEIQMTNAQHAVWGPILHLASFGNTNGATPVGGLTLGSDGKLYGVAAYGGDTDRGEFYSLPGTGGPITGLASFNNFGGVSPHTPLTLGPDGNFYGTTSAGGPGDNGTVFRISANGTFSRIAVFTNSSTSGYQPLTPLCVGPDGVLYGSTMVGGANSGGTLFSVTTNGVFKTVYNFASASSGIWPMSGLALGPDNQLYGTTETGGTNGSGTIFRYNTNGTLSVFFSFSGTNGNKPQGSLLWNRDGYCYGITYSGGAGGNGTIFRFNTSGAFNTVATFFSTNGYGPVSGLALGADGNLYGVANGNSYLYRITPGASNPITVVNNASHLSGSIQYAGFAPGPDKRLYTATANGGTFNNGSLIRMDTNGVTALVSTLSTALGTYLYAAPVFGPDGNLYGTTSAGGPGNGGTVYRYVFDRITSFQRVGTNAVITATGTTGGNYALFATTNLATGIWTNIAVSVAGNSAVTLSDTNAGKFPKRFYRTAAQ